MTQSKNVLFVGASRGDDEFDPPGLGSKRVSRSASNSERLPMMLTPDQIVAEGRRLVERWIDLLARKDIDSALDLLGQERDMELRETVLKSIHWYVETGRGEVDWEDPWPPELEEKALDPANLPITPLRDMPPARADQELMIGRPDFSAEPPGWFAIDHALPINGAWTNLYALFEGDVVNGKVVLRLITLKDM